MSGVGGYQRRKLREKYNLRHAPCGDCTVHLFCSPCAVCQESRELRVSTSKCDLKYASYLLCLNYDDKLSVGLCLGM